MGKPVVWIDNKNKLTAVLNGLEIPSNRNSTISVGGQNFSAQSIKMINSETAEITLPEPLPLGEEAFLRWKGNRLPVYPRDVVRTPWFEETFDAREEKLGYTYAQEKTSFAVWAPTAVEMVLNLEGMKVTMVRKSNGVWHTAVAGDWNNARYYFIATVNGNEVQVNDPYSKSMTANSERSVVIDLEATDPKGFRTINYPNIFKQDAIIYELHVRDASSSIDSGVQHKGKFLGMTERGTKTSAGYSTGLSYIKQFGCTHVQILPIQDFARVDELNPNESYNWGYDPLFYFAPEGSYATDANNAYSRVNECKQMIQAFHEEGLSVILDVVYNHVFCQKDSVFEKLVPGYYFRYQSDRVLSNGTGTGNDLATERTMVRKLILDCIDYWIEEYHVDGFRLDLMGALDVETMKAINESCRQEDRPLLLLGEGWELDTPLAPEQKTTIAQSGQVPEVSFFNDVFRDSLKGNTFHARSSGYANGNGYFAERMPQLVSGSCNESLPDRLFLNPLQSVNYVECHDNHTLWDRLKQSNPHASELVRKKMHQLATGLTILSQGVPFLHAGQEFFRTKKGDGNSYISSDDVNQMDWVQRGKEDENVQWVRRLIALRKQHGLFRIESASEIKHRLHIVAAPNPVFGYMLAGEREDFAIFVNPTDQTAMIDMPAQGRWEKVISNHENVAGSISCLLQIRTEIEAYELAVWQKKRA